MNQMRAALLKSSSGDLKEMVERAEEKRKKEAAAKRQKRQKEREPEEKQPVAENPNDEGEKVVINSRTEGIGEWAPCSDLIYKPGSKVTFKGKSLARVGWSLHSKEEKRPVHVLRLEQPYTYESGHTATGWLIADEDSIQKSDAPRQTMREIR